VEIGRGRIERTLERPEGEGMRGKKWKEEQVPVEDHMPSESEKVRQRGGQQESERGAGHAKVDEPLRTL